MSKWALFLLHNTWHCAMPSWRWLWSRTGNADALHLLLLNSQATATANVASETLRESLDTGHFSLWSASGSPRSSASFKNSSWNGYVSVRLLCSIFSTTIFYNDFDPQNVPVLPMHGHLALPSPHHANRTCDTSNVWDIESMIQIASDSCYVGAMLQKASD